METNRPRHYLFAYIAADGDKKKQGEALAGMPVEFRPLLTTYIGIHKERNNERTAKQGNKSLLAKRP